MPKINRSLATRRKSNRRAMNTSSASLAAPDNRSRAPAFNAEQLGEPTALASWVGQRLASLLRRIRRKER